MWDTKQKGQLSSRSGNGFSEEYFYDGFSRLSRQIVTTAGLSGGEFIYTYDNFSRPETVKYPNGFKIQRDYHADGYQVKTRDVTVAATPKILWALGNTIDARGAFNNQLWGNGVVTQTGFDANSGRLSSIKSGRLSSTNSIINLHGDIQNLSYTFDSLGNLRSRTTARTDSNGLERENITEAYGYDKLNRVTTSTTSGLFGRTQTYQYDTGGLGNLINRSDVLSGSSINNDVGELKYEQVRNAGVHAVTSANGTNYSYDKYGNMTARGSESIIYDTFNKPTRIVGASITDFYYGPDHELYKEVSGTKTTYKLAGGLYEVIVDGTTTTQKSYVDGVIINNRVLTNGTQSANDTVFLHTDHLGSVEATTNALGQFVNRMSFGAWGERQKSDWKPGNPTESFLTSNGFTGHDQLDNHNLVHMGGRVYDPALGRFLSADLFIQSPYNTQSFNRYSYTFNNPLSFVDPDGYRSKSVGARDLDSAAAEILVTGRRNGLTGRDMDNFIRDQIAQSSQTELLLMYGDVGKITAINGIAFFGVAEATFGAGRGDEAQQEADVRAAEDFLGTGVVLAARLAAPGPGGKVKAADKVNDAVKSGNGLTLSQAKNALKTGEKTDKGNLSQFGKQLEKHMDVNNPKRNPDTWGGGPLKGSNDAKSQKGYDQFREIFNSPGSFAPKANQNGTVFLEKWLPDGRGVRLNQDGSFKGFVD